LTEEKEMNLKNLKAALNALLEIGENPDTKEAIAFLRYQIKLIQLRGKS
jgi:hypothetical protein